MFLIYTSIANTCILLSLCMLAIAQGQATMLMQRGNDNNMGLGNNGYVDIQALKNVANAIKANV